MVEADRMKQPAEEMKTRWTLDDLEYFHTTSKGAFETKDYDQGFKLAQKALEIAEAKHLEAYHEDVESTLFNGAVSFFEESRIQFQEAFEGGDFKMATVVAKHALERAVALGHADEMAEFGQKHADAEEKVHSHKMSLYLEKAHKEERAMRYQNALEFYEIASQSANVLFKLGRLADKKIKHLNRKKATIQKKIDELTNKERYVFGPRFLNLLLETQQDAMLVDAIERLAFIREGADHEYYTSEDMIAQLPLKSKQRSSLKSLMEAVDVPMKEVKEFKSKLYAKQMTELARDQDLALILIAESLLRKDGGTKVFLVTQDSLLASNFEQFLANPLAKTLFCPDFFAKLKQDHPNSRDLGFFERLYNEFTQALRANLEVKRFSKNEEVLESIKGDMEKKLNENSESRKEKEKELEGTVEEEPIPILKEEEEEEEPTVEEEPIPILKEEEESAWMDDHMNRLDEQLKTPSRNEQPSDNSQLNAHLGLESLTQYIQDGGDEEEEEKKEERMEGRMEGKMEESNIYHLSSSSMPQYSVVSKLLESDVISPITANKRIVNCANALKALNYRLISSQHRLANILFEKIDLLAIKVFSIPRQHKDIIHVLPIKFSNLNGSFIVSEERINYRGSDGILLDEETSDEMISSAISELSQTFETIHKSLMNCNRFYDLLKQHLRVALEPERSMLTKKVLYLRAGPMLYNVAIDPILICNNDFTESTIPFAYQKRSNLHFTQAEGVAELASFLEQKYVLIETHAKQSNIKEELETSSQRFMEFLHYSSLPLFAMGACYIIFILVLRNLQAYNILSMISIPTLIAYIGLLVFFRAKLEMKKNEIHRRYSSKYHQKAFKIEDNDFFLIAEDLGDNGLLKQFSYELYGKKKIITSSMSNRIINDKGDQKTIIRDAKKKELKPRVVDDELMMKYNHFLED